VLFLCLVEITHKYLSEHESRTGVMGPNLLLVNNKPVEEKILNTLLKDLGNVIVETGITGARQRMESTAIDLVIIDMNSQTDLGIMLYDEIRLKNPNLTAIILLGDESTEEDEIHAFDIGFADVIHKPYKKTAIRARIIRHLNSQQSNKEVKILAMEDNLTKLPNRNKFNTVFSTECDRAVRNQDTISILILDIDHFKLYNDYYGHLQGDRALYELAQCLRKSVKRPGDIAGRWGGEEFSILLPRTDVGGVKVVCERLMYDIREAAIEHKPSPVSDYLTVSIGAVTATYTANMVYTPDLTTALLKLADDNLYEAKRTGRNKFVQTETFYSSTSVKNALEKATKDDNE